MRANESLQRDNRTEAGIAGRPREALFQLFVITGESVEKVRQVTDQLTECVSHDFLLDVLCGGEAAGDASRLGERVRVWSFPGESVFHLRSRVPSLARDNEWIVILEDHNHIYQAWPHDLSRVLRAADSRVQMIIGAANNETSTDAWSWANFLCVLGFHWAPRIQTPLEPLGFNVAIRRGLFPKNDFALGAYETEFMPGLMRRARPSADFPVDHVQFRSFPEVLYYHWCNGRATGAFMNRFSGAGFRKVLSHARNSSFQRQRRLRQVIQTHPKACRLPRYTSARTQLLAIAHSLGAIYGGLASTGKALWALE